MGWPRKSQQDSANTVERSALRKGIEFILHGKTLQAEDVI